MCGAYSLELGVTHLALSQFVTYEKGEKMSEIARFYGFTVSMDNTFTGNPNIFIDYEEDNIRGHFDLEKGEFTDAVFPQYLVKVIMEWIGDHIQVLKAMWNEKMITELPDWE